MHSISPFSSYFGGFNSSSDDSRSSIRLSLKRLMPLPKANRVVISIDQSGYVWCEIRREGLRLVRCFEGAVQAAEDLHRIGLISATFCRQLASGLERTVVIRLPRDYDVTYLPWLGFDMELA